MSQDRVMAGLQDGDGGDAALRPPGFAEFRGQDKAVRALQIAVAGARSRGEVMDHVLLGGPPGLGKTTLASILASEMGGQLKTVMGPSVSRPGDLAAVLVSLGRGDFLFLDEVHRLPQPAQEILYGAMEDFRLDILAAGPDGGGRAMSLPLERFTLVGATTRPGMLAAPFRDRFHVLASLEPYDEETLAGIVSRSAGLLGAELEDGVADEVARRSRGTPRIANRFLRRLRDHAAFHGEPRLTLGRAVAAFGEMGVAEDGTTESDRRYLELLAGRFAGRPVGLKTLAAAMGEDEGTLEWEVEPWLVRNGYVERTPRGRVAGPKVAPRLL